LAAVVVAGFAAAGVAGCAHSPAPASSSPIMLHSGVVDQSQQVSMTPDAALARLKEGNERLLAGTDWRRDYRMQIKATSGGQYPFAAVLCCSDSRSAPEILFDQGIGDLFVARIAGNYTEADITGSLEFATKVAGSKLIVVLGHTECGAIKGACDNVEMGNLTTVIHALRPAVVEVKGFDNDRTSRDKAFVRAVTEANVRRTVAALRATSPILKDLETSGQIRIVGAMYDISTGKVTFLD
jgi:carbonic anhydrase